jgi:hypothetical protein
MNINLDEYVIIMAVDKEIVKEIYIRMQKGERYDAWKLFRTNSKLTADDIDYILAKLEAEMIQNNEIPNASQKNLKLCGACNTYFPSHYGLFFYAGEEWQVHRLFLCQKCMKNIPVQRVYQIGPLNDDQGIQEILVDESLVADFWQLRDEYLKTYKEVFDKLPATTDENFKYELIGDGIDDDWYINDWLRKHNRSD